MEQRPRAHLARSTEYLLFMVLLADVDWSSR